MAIKSVVTMKKEVSGVEGKTEANERYQKKSMCRVSKINTNSCSFEVLSNKEKIKPPPCVEARSKCRS